jgi:hypothetical protein
MKRVVPVDLGSSVEYPTLTEASAARRGFLRTALAEAAVVGGTLLGAAPVAGRSKPVTLLEVLLTRVHYFGGCNYTVRKLIVQSADDRLIAFLRAESERAGLTEAVLKVLRAYGCDDVADRKRLARLERDVARAVLGRFTASQQRSAPLPIVNLVLENRRPVLRGRVRNPSYP